MANLEDLVWIVSGYSEVNAEARIATTIQESDRSTSFYNLANCFTSLTTALRMVLSFKTLFCRSSIKQTKHH